MIDITKMKVSEARHRASAIKVAALVCITFLATGCAAMQARQQRIQAARGACYKVDPGTVYQETFSVVASQYQIARESERRGFIETEFLTTTDAYGTQQSKKVHVEVIAGACTRMALRVEGLQLNTQTNQYDPVNMTNEEDELYLQIHARVNQASAASAPPPAPAPAPAPAPVAAPAPAPAPVAAPTPAPAPATVAKPPGSEGAVCYGNGTCDGNLTCASNLCVRLPSR